MAEIDLVVPLEKCARGIVKAGRIHSEIGTKYKTRLIQCDIVAMLTVLGSV